MFLGVHKRNESVQKLELLLAQNFSPYTSNLVLGTTANKFLPKFCRKFDLLQLSKKVVLAQNNTLDAYRSNFTKTSENYYAQSPKKQLGLSQCLWFKMSLVA